MRPLHLCLPVFALAACGGSTAQRPAPVTPAVVAQTAPAPTPPTPRAPRWTPRQGPSLEALLRVHRAWAPTPSPDGRRVVFLSDASGLPLAHTADVGATPAAETSWTRLLESTERVQYAHWAPGAAGIFFGQDTGGDENTRIHRIVPGQAAAALTPAGVKTFLGTFNTRGTAFAFTSNERDRGAFDVYVRNTVGDAPARRVMETTGHYEAQDFSADGRTLAVVEERGSFDTDVHLVPSAGGPSRRITTHTGDVRWMAPRFSRDGRALFVITDEGREFMNLAVLPLNGPADAPRIAPTFLHEEAHDVDLFEVSREGSVMAAVLNVDGYSQLRLYNLATTAPLTERPRPQLPPGNIGSMTFAQNGAALFVSLGRAVSPDEVWRVDTRTGAATQVTAADHGEFTEQSFVEPTLERVASFDGLEVPFFLFRPRGMQPGDRAPAVVWVHGGPEAQFTPYFSPVIQYLVASGYVVAAPNVRGSTGYGKRYAHLDDVALREDSVRDLEHVNQWLRGRDYVLPDRIAVTGGSYGGYMVLAAITLQPTLWAAACDIVGIANFRTFLERTASYRRALREAEYGSLARDGEVLDRVSPIHRVDRIRAPLFVIHGANDPRVPVHEAEQIVAALRGRNQRVEYVRFENEGHGIFRLENKVRAYGELVRFFNDVLGAP
jgi:dipeptidyl aminopeptidase/acylaminoacyl peptidase